MKYAGHFLGLLFPRLVLFGLLSLCVASSNVQIANAASGDADADRVLGQTSTNCNPCNFGSALNNLSSPFGVAIDPSGGNFYVADSNNNRVLVWLGGITGASFTNGKAADFSISTDNNTPGHPLNVPSGAAVDKNGNLYVADRFNNRILQYTAPLTASKQAGLVIGQTSFSGTSPGTTSTTLRRPFSVAVDNNGNLYVADTTNNRVLVYNAPLATGNPANLVIGQPNFTSSSENQGLASPAANTLSSPSGVAVDSSGNLFVSDTGNNRVLQFVPPLSDNMNATKVIGQTGFSTHVKSSSATALNTPYGIAVASNGNLFVVDTFNNRLLMFPTPVSSGMAATWVIGQQDFASNNPNRGNGASAASNSLSSPYGIAVDNAQNTYIADQGNNRVLGYDMMVSFHVYFPIIRK